MNTNRSESVKEVPEKCVHRGGHQPPRIWVCLVLTLAVVVVTVLAFRQRIGRDLSPADPVVTSTEPLPDSESNLSDQGSVGAREGRVSSLSSTTPSGLEVSAHSRELVERLCQPGPAGSWTPEMAADWKELVRQTLELGREAVPGIREFLAKNEDYDWGGEGRRLLGYDSARAAMFDVLAQIGGVEAEDALLSTLKGALDPREIALLARNLDTLAPAQHGAVSLEAAQQSLMAAKRGELADRDVAPLFEVLNRFGGGLVATDIEQAAGLWNHYSAIALAQMPDGSGVASLIRLAEGIDTRSRLGTDPAVRMLGSLAAENDDARSAFLELVKKDRIPASTWATLPPMLAGDRVQFTGGVFGDGLPIAPDTIVRRVHLNYGNQNYSTTAPSADQWSHQLEWLDQLAAVAHGSAAQTAVQRARDLVERRLYEPMPPVGGGN